MLLLFSLIRNTDVSGNNKKTTRIVTNYFRLHRMHEMLTVLTGVRGVCLFVCLSVTRLISASLFKNGWTDEDAVLGEHSLWPMEHCVRRGS